MAKADNCRPDILVWVDQRMQQGPRSEKYLPRLKLPVLNVPLPINRERKTPGKEPGLPKDWQSSTITSFPHTLIKTHSSITPSTPRTASPAPVFNSIHFVEQVILSYLSNPSLLKQDSSYRIKITKQQKIQQSTHGGTKQPAHHACAQYAVRSPVRNRYPAACLHVLRTAGWLARTQMLTQYLK